MIKNIDKYLDYMLSSQISVSSLEDALKIMKANKEVEEILDNPLVTPDDKKKAAEDLFMPSVRDIIDMLAEDCKVFAFEEIIEAYIEEADKRNHIADAVVYCVTEPDEQQIEGIKKFVCRETGCVLANVKIVKDESLVGGFIVHAGGKEFDFSLKGKFDSIKNQVMQSARNSSVDHESVIAVLRKDINDFEHMKDGEEFGSVVRVGDSIATIAGLEHAMYGEIVIFENGVKGMVQDIKRHQIGVIIFGSDVGVHQGTKVKRTHKKAGVPCGDSFIGRVVNALGEPIDGKVRLRQTAIALLKTVPRR